MDPTRAGQRWRDRPGQSTVAMQHRTSADAQSRPRARRPGQHHVRREAGQVLQLERCSKQAQAHDFLHRLGRLVHLVSFQKVPDLAPRVSNLRNDNASLEV